MDTHSLLGLETIILKDKWITVYVPDPLGLPLTSPFLRYFW